MMMEDCYQNGDESQCETCADDSDSNNNNNNSNSNSNVGRVGNQNYISLDVVRERLLRNNESYLIQCGEYVNTVLKEGIIHAESLAFEDRQVYDLYRKKQFENVGERNIHSDKLYACSHCDRTFALRNTRNRHTREVHVLRESFPCTRCDKSYSRRHNRDRHMKLCPMGDYSFSSYIRGKHAYKFWRPVVDTILTCQREEENKYDPSAVSVIFENRVAGHVPREVSHIFTEFLHGGGSIDAKITGTIVNRGYGLEVPVDYHFIGPKTSICKVKESLEA